MAVVANQAVAFDKSMSTACRLYGQVAISLSTDEDRACSRL
jgi:hypothetical protein